MITIININMEHKMSNYIIAQLVGFLGYIFYVSAPHLKTKNNIMCTELIAYTILCAQWYLLEQHSLLALNAITAIATIAILHTDRKYWIKKALPLLYPTGIALIIWTSKGSLIDIIAICAFICAMHSKLSNDILEFRGYALLTGTILTISSAMAHSIPATIFNFVFSIGHAKNIHALPEINIKMKAIVNSYKQRSWSHYKAQTSLPTQ